MKASFVEWKCERSTSDNIRRKKKARYLDKYINVYSQLIKTTVCKQSFSFKKNAHTKSPCVEDLTLKVEMFSVKTISMLC